MGIGEEEEGKGAPEQKAMHANNSEAVNSGEKPRNHSRHHDVLINMAHNATVDGFIQWPSIQELILPQSS